MPDRIRPYAALLYRVTLLIVLHALASPVVSAAMERVPVPVKLDYQLLQQILVRQQFSRAGTAEIPIDASGCSRIVLSDPRIGEEDGRLEVFSQFQAALGAQLLGSCNQLVDWRGGISFLAEPLIQPGGRSVRLEPRDVRLRDASGNLITSGQVRDVAVQHLQDFLNAFTLDLSPHIESLGRLLPDVLPSHSARQLQSMVNSLQLSGLAVTPTGLAAELTFEVETVPPVARGESAFSAAEMQQLEERWQTMDALLVSAVKYYASATGLQSLRDVLFDVLLDSRYRLREALTAPPNRLEDDVRKWFLDSWQQLGPVVRDIALEQPGQEHLLWFSVLAATDALDALDRLGPGVGLDISVDGLRRLARMINADQGEMSLLYSEEVDPELQQLMRQRFAPRQSEPAAWRLDLSLFPRAVAASSPERLNSWAPRRNDLDDYLPLVAQLLENNAEKIMREHGLESRYRALFTNMVLATAWQESCWRQYVVKKDKLVPLRSGTGDVGLMQINERVWRGLYDMHRLRWDIDYNSSAGAEVLINYLTRYAIRNGEQTHSGGITNLARASYSAYNGGPSRVSRYRSADVPAAHRKIDAAFWDKFQQVDAGHAMRVAACLGGVFSGGQ